MFIFNCYKEDSHKHNSLILDRYMYYIYISNDWWYIGFTIFPLRRLFRWPAEHKEERKHIYIQRVEMKAKKKNLVKIIMLHISYMKVLQL